MNITFLILKIEIWILLFNFINRFKYKSLNITPLNIKILILSNIIKNKNNNINIIIYNKQYPVLTFHEYNQQIFSVQMLIVRVHIQYDGYVRIYKYTNFLTPQ